MPYISSPFSLEGGEDYIVFSAFFFLTESERQFAVVFCDVYESIRVRLTLLGCRSLLRRRCGTRLLCLLCRIAVVLLARLLRCLTLLLGSCGLLIVALRLVALILLGLIATLLRHLSLLLGLIATRLGHLSLLLRLVSTLLGHLTLLLRLVSALLGHLTLLLGLIAALLRHLSLLLRLVSTLLGLIAALLGLLTIAVSSVVSSIVVLGKHVVERFYLNIDKGHHLTIIPRRIGDGDIANDGNETPICTGLGENLAQAFGLIPPEVGTKPDGVTIVASGQLPLEVLAEGLASSVDRDFDVHNGLPVLVRLQCGSLLKVVLHDDGISEPSVRLDFFAEIEQSRIARLVSVLPSVLILLLVSALRRITSLLLGIVVLLLVSALRRITLILLGLLSLLRITSLLRLIASSLLRIVLLIVVVGHVLFPPLCIASKSKDE